MHQPGNGAVTNGNQEALGGHGRQAHHPLTGFFQVDTLGGERLTHKIFALEAAQHFRRFAEQQIHGQIHRCLAEMLIAHGEVLGIGGFAQYGVGGALTLTNGVEVRHIVWHHGQHITFLGFITPNFHRAHAGLGTGHFAQLQLGAHIMIVDQLRQGVGQTAGAHIVDGYDRVIVPAGPAAIDHFLHPTFNLRVLTLH